MRIIGGEFKGRKLFSVRGSDIRPSGGKLKEAVFSIAAASVPEGRVLDLYAGTGSFGLEALSRGARMAVFVDYDSRAISAIKENIQLLRVRDRTWCIRWDISKSLNCLQAMTPPFDLVFIDPPYNQEVIAPTLSHLGTCRCLAHRALIVVEHGTATPFPEAIPSCFERLEQRKYGKSLVTFFSHVLTEA